MMLINGPRPDMLIECRTTPDGVKHIFRSEVGDVEVPAGLMKYAHGSVGRFHGGAYEYMQKWAKFQIYFKGVK